MSAVILAVVSLLLLALGYIFYSPKVAKWLGIDDSHTTPAVEINDGVDYVPAKHWTILFGHHFASIAGAAPIIGPVIACLYWGWLPAVIWIVVGGILFGAVHDFASLALSARHKGKSIAALTESGLGKGAKIAFTIFVFLALILVVAIFAAVAGKTLANTPQIVIPTFGLIVVAVVVGFLMYNLKLPALLCTVIGLLCLFLLIVAGYFYPVDLTRLGASVGLTIESPEKWWTVILLVYGLVASVTPVSLLLQPRDHLAAAVLFVGMVLGFLGLVITLPELKAPAIVSFSSDKGWLWPMMFVTIACGAISGFHSMVASGTTSKQLLRMRDARAIGFGGMITESALSILAVLAVSAGLYWTRSQLPDGVNGPIYSELCDKGNWIGTFGVGYDQITRGLLGPIGAKLGIVGLGSLIGITMLKTFVMTTLDSATRITRYICNELFGDTFGIRALKNKYLATLLVGVLAGALALGNWQAIYPVFGASNQLIASVVLIVVSVYLLKRGKNCLFTAVPAALMLLTTMAALVYKTWSFLKSEKGPNWMLASVSILLILLAVFIFYRGVVVARKELRT